MGPPRFFPICPRKKLCRCVHLATSLKLPWPHGHPLGVPRNQEMTDYKYTLNLPRTGFPMKAVLVEREPKRLAQWEAEHLYQKIQARRAGARRFVLHDGPPFANGD